MKYSYNPEPSEKVKALGRKIIELLVSSNVTHKEASEALRAAEEMMFGLKLVK